MANEGCADAALFDGDYILDLVDRDATACRWELQFDPHCRLYRATLVARSVSVPLANRSVSVPLAQCGTAASAVSGGAAASAISIELRAALEGAVPGPTWTCTSPLAFDHSIVLRAENSIAAGCRWPETTTITPVLVGQAFQPDGHEFHQKPRSTTTPSRRLPIASRRRLTPRRTLRNLNPAPVALVRHRCAALQPCATEQRPPPRKPR